MKRKCALLTFGVFIPFIVVCLVAYFLLLRDNCLHISIHSIIVNSHHLAVKTHLLVMGLLPIYIASMLLGATMLGVYLGSTLQHLLLRCVKATC